MKVVKTMLGTCSITSVRGMALRNTNKELNRSVGYENNTFSLYLSMNSDLLQQYLFQ